MPKAECQSRVLGRQHLLGGPAGGPLHACDVTSPPRRVRKPQLTRPTGLSGKHPRRGHQRGSGPLPLALPRLLPPAWAAFWGLPSLPGGPWVPGPDSRDRCSGQRSERGKPGSLASRAAPVLHSSDLHHTGLGAKPLIAQTNLLPYCPGVQSPPWKLHQLPSLRASGRQGRCCHSLAADGGARPREALWLLTPCCPPAPSCWTKGRVADKAGFRPSSSKPVVTAF